MIFNNSVFNNDFYSDIIEEIGEQYAWECSYKLGGQRIYLPKNPKAEHPVKKYLSTILADYLLDRYAGEAIIIPLGSQSYYKQKKTQAELLILQGYNHSQVASKLGISFASSRRYKKHALKKINLEKQNQDLFEEF